MALNIYFSAARNALYSTNEYLNTIRDHRDTIIRDLSPTILTNREANYYRHRIRAYLTSKGYPIQYHLAIMVLNRIKTEFDFGYGYPKETGNDIVTIYLPPITDLDNYGKKVSARIGG